MKGLGLEDKEGENVGEERDLLSEGLGISGGEGIDEGKDEIDKGCEREAKEERLFTEGIDGGGLEEGRRKR